jgi:Holliday junction resolvase RusA-like endonuclease
MVLKIPRRLDSPNTWNGRHWRVKHRLSQQWEQAVWVEAAMTRGRPTVAQIARQHLGGGEPRKMRVTVERQVPSKRNFIRDDDNLRFAVKPLLDALKRGGYVYDDARKWLEHPTPTQCVSEDGKDWTIVIIEAIQ